MKKTINKQLAILVKPASAGCNLRCRYCFYADESQNRAVASHGLMNYDTLDLLILRIREYLPSGGKAIISFQGGEPTLAGLAFFRNFISRMKKHPDIEAIYGIQTNATLLTRKWARFFRENGFLVGVSLDGFRTNMDMFRCEGDGSSVYDRVMAGISLLKEEEVPFNILTVVTRELASHPEELCEYLIKNRFEQVQLIPCLPLMQQDDDGMSLTPELFESFHKRFFDRWYENHLHGGQLSVNLYENLAVMLSGQPPYQCGMTGNCFIQYVVEANGDVYPCDFYCLDEELLGNLSEASFSQLAESPAAGDFLKKGNCENSLCPDCPFREMCHGGCRRQNVCWLDESHCAYRSVLDHILPRLQYLLGVKL